MFVPEEKKLEYWNYFIEMWALDRNVDPHELTPTKLRKIKPKILNDSHFWADIVARHGGLQKSPYQLKEENEQNYNHCLGNFWGMLSRYMRRL